MNWLLIAIAIGLFPAVLAAKLPRRQKTLLLDRKTAVGLQVAGGLALVGGLIWWIWLVPQLLLSAGCGIASGLLLVLTLFTVSLPCQSSIPIWVDIADGLMAFGVACLTFGTSRRVVLGKGSSQEPGDWPP